MLKLPVKVDIYTSKAVYMYGVSIVQWNFGTIFAVSPAWIAGSSPFAAALALTCC